MTSDLVKRLRLQSETSLVRLPEDHVYVSHSDAADYIEKLERAVLDLAQYISNADLVFYIEPKTRSILREIEEKTK